MGIPIYLHEDFRPAMKKIMEKLGELEEKIGLIKSNTEFMIGSSNKNFRKVKDNYSKKDK